MRADGSKVGVVAVTPGAAASKAGIGPGALLLAIDGSSPKGLGPVGGAHMTSVVKGVGREITFDLAERSGVRKQLQLAVGR